MTGSTADERPHGTEVATRVLRRFRSVFNAVKKHFQQVERVAGLGGAQLWALSLVHDRPGIGVNGLAREMDVHQTTASNLVKGLMDKGLIEAPRDEADRRAVRLKLLAQGVALLSIAPGPFAGVLPDALAALDMETLTRLDEDLGKLLSHLRDRPTDSGHIPLGDL